MRNKFIAAVSVSVLLLLAACIKDTAYRTYTYTLYRPVYKTSDQVRANIKSSAPHNITSSGKMYISGNYIFLSENGLGVHVINNTDPSNPVNESYINIPGCTDIAAKGDILYADCYTDLLTIDISNPKDVQLKSHVVNLFPDRQYVLGYHLDSGKVIAEWIVKDTTVTEKMELDNFFGGAMYKDAFISTGALNNSTTSFSSSGGKASTGGSMARFAIQSNHLYAVTNTSLQVLDLIKPLQPQWKTTVNLGWGIETIYPFKDKLFVGSNDGMRILNASNPANPQVTGTFSHARVCDPVIANDKYAYVTLRAGTRCFGNTNQMDVVNVSDISNPSLVKSYPFTNPRGLGMDGNVLFLCEGPSEVKILNTTNPLSVVTTQIISIAESYDVICADGLAIITAKDGIYQYSYTPAGTATLLSKIGIVK